METIALEGEEERLRAFLASSPKVPVILETANHSPIGYLVPLEDRDIIKGLYAQKLRRMIKQSAQKANLTEAEAEEYAERL